LIIASSSKRAEILSWKALRLVSTIGGDASKLSKSEQFRAYDESLNACNGSTLLVTTLSSTTLVGSGFVTDVVEATTLHTPTMVAVEFSESINSCRSTSSALWHAMDE